MQLKPSEIRFSQDSINNYFDKRSLHSRTRIGETLDSLCDGRCNIDDIPRVTVVRESGRWITADNRRLWVFRELERLGKCETIPICFGYSIPSAKRTSYYDGVTIRVRGDPGGYWHTRSNVTRPLHNNQHQSAQTYRSQSARNPTTSGLNYRKQYSSDLAYLEREFQRVVRTQRSGTGYGSLTTFPGLDTLSTSIDYLRYQRKTKFATKYAYGIRYCRPFISGMDPELNRIIFNGEHYCNSCFDRHISKMTTVTHGKSFGVKFYTLPNCVTDYINLGVFKSTVRDPRFVDQIGCSLHSQHSIDLRNISSYGDRTIVVEMVYIDRNSLEVRVTVQNKRQIFETCIEVEEIEF